MLLAMLREKRTLLFLLAAAGGNTPGAATTTSPATQTPGATGAGTGVGSKTTPTAPYLINGGASLRGATGLVLALAAVAVYAV